MNAENSNLRELTDGYKSLMKAKLMSPERKDYLHQMLKGDMSPEKGERRSAPPQLTNDA